MKYTIKELDELWCKLGDIPVNAKDEIDKSFHLWRRGTDKFQIWHWFDELYPEGLYKRHFTGR